MRTMVATALFVFVVGCGLAASAAEPSTANGNSGEITLEQCRIRLIDQVTLASDRMGILAFVEPDEGDRVEAGQVIAGLRDEIARATVARAQKESENDVEVRYAHKAAEVAQVEYEKAIEANQRVRGAVPDIEVRRLKLAAERSLLQIEQAEHQMQINKLTRDEAQAQLDTHHVTAPFSGVVTRRFRSKGEAVRQGDPILEVVSTDRVRVEGDVAIAAAWRISPGMPVRVRLDVPGAPRSAEDPVFEGKVAFVDVTVEPVTRRVRVWAEVENPGNVLRAGLGARMVILTEAGRRSAVSGRR
jgi:membrane fusion protein (multidrug efflux system)